MKRILFVLLALISVKSFALSDPMLQDMLQEERDKNLQVWMMQH